jgi:hypothetical protein
MTIPDIHREVLPIVSRLALLRDVTGARPSIASAEPASTGTEHYVSTRAEWIALTDNISTAFNDGDTIIIEDGEYDDWDLTFIRGRDVQNALIKPQTYLGVTFSGNTTFRSTGKTKWWGFNVDKGGSGSGADASFMIAGGDGITTGHECEFIGFTLTGGGSSANDIMFDIRANDCVVQDCTFNQCNARVWNVTVVTPPGSGLTPTGFHAHHNTTNGSTGAIKWMGCGGGIWDDWNDPYDGFSTSALIEFNYVQDWLGNAEIGGFKASDNVFRFNYFRNSGDSGARMNVRTGHRNVFYGNFFQGSKIGFGSQGDDNVFMFNHVTATNLFDDRVGFQIACDHGDEVGPEGRDIPSVRAIYRYNILDGYYWGYTPGNGKDPINALPSDCEIDNNFWLTRPGDQAFVEFTNSNYEFPEGTPITQAAMEAVNTINLTTPVAAASFDPPFWLDDESTSSVSSSSSVSSRTLSSSSQTMSTSSSSTSSESSSSSSESSSQWSSSSQTMSTSSSSSESSSQWSSSSQTNSTSSSSGIT